MLTVSTDQMEAPRAGALRALWADHAAQAGLPASDAGPLGERTVAWLMGLRIRDDRNLHFVMQASARSRGAFLDAPPVHEALRLSGGQHDTVVGAIRRQTAALVRGGG